MGPGQRLGNYELLCPIARGGMAEVWMARLVGTRGFQKPVAIKIMLPSIREDPDSERMFLSEAAIASRIRHPNVVEILDLGEHDDVLYLVMEWIHGEPLTAVLTAAAQRGGIPFGVASRIGYQIAMGLEAAHELTDDAGEPLGVVHRDVSPHNVLVGFNGVVKVVDFGIAKAATDSTNRTEFGQLKGKVAYMAPEQIRFEPIDRRTDTFAAGIILYMLTTGVHPFKRSELHETALAICSKDPVRSPRSFVEKYPERLERVVLQALAKDPAARYATARELGDELLRAFPPSFKGTGHEELQAYMKDVLPERLAHHQELIRKALATPGSGTSAPRLLAVQGPARSASTLRAVAVSGPAAAPDVAEGTPEDQLDDPAVRPTLIPSRRTKTTLAMLGGALFGALAIVAVTGPRRTTPQASGSSSMAPAMSASASTPANAERLDPSHEGEHGATASSESAADAGARAPSTAPIHPVVPVTRLPSTRIRPRVRHDEGHPGTDSDLKDPYGSQ